MKKFILPKLIGLAILTMITLVIISFLEVAVYSYFIHPGQEQSVYEAHAKTSNLLMRMEICKKNFN